MTVSIVSIAAHASDGVCISFSITNGNDSQSERLVISAADMADLRLCVGDCDEACFDAVLAASRKYEAKKRALSLLSFGRHSPKALARKLGQKGIDRKIATETVKDLIHRGYLNPRADAYAEANACVAKGWGKLRISSALREKGYSDVAVRYAMERLDEDGVDYIAGCANWIQRYGDIPSDPRERAKRYASLVRYGYTASDIRQALRFLEKKS